jgi:hypothetical protein
MQRVGKAITLYISRSNRFYVLLESIVDVLILEDLRSIFQRRS